MQSLTWGRGAPAQPRRPAALMPPGPLGKQQCRRRRLGLPRSRHLPTCPFSPETSSNRTSGTRRENRERGTAARRPWRGSHTARTGALLASGCTRGPLTALHPQSRFSVWFSSCHFLWDGFILFSSMALSPSFLSRPLSLPAHGWPCPLEPLTTYPNLTPHLCPCWPLFSSAVTRETRRKHDHVPCCPWTGCVVTVPGTLCEESTGAVCGP